MRTFYTLVCFVALDVAFSNALPRYDCASGTCYITCGANCRGVDVFSAAYHNDTLPYEDRWTFVFQAGSYDCYPWVLNRTFSVLIQSDGGLVTFVCDKDTDIDVQNASLTVRDVTFEGSAAGLYSLAIKSEYDGVAITLDRCTFTYFVNPNKFSLRVSGGAQVTMINSTVMNINSDVGVVFAGENSELTIVDCLFSSTTVTVGGSVHCAGCSRLVVDRTTVDRARGTAGGCVFASGTGVSVEVDGLDCRYSTAVIGGGLYLNVTDPVKLQVTNSVFDANTVQNGFDCVPVNGAHIFAVAKGNRTSLDASNTVIRSGEIYACSDGHVSGSIYLRNVGFEGVDAPFRVEYMRYGAFIVDDGPMTIRNGVVFRCDGPYSADIGGGGLFAHGTADVALIDMTFANNTGEYGGAVYIGPEATVSADHCHFEANEAEADGGAVFSQGTYLDFSCTYTKNVAKQAGGAILANYSFVDVSNSVFDGNSAYFGAGVYGNNSVVNMQSVLFDKNKFLAFGGGIVLNNTEGVVGETSHLNDCTFSYNAAGNFGGAGILMGDRYSDFAVANAAIHHNTALDYGGGLMIMGSATVSGVATNNMAAVGGAVFHCFACGSVDLSGLTTTSNTATMYGADLATDIAEFRFTSDSDIAPQAAGTLLEIEMEAYDGYGAVVTTLPPPYYNLDDPFRRPYNASAMTPIKLLPSDDTDLVAVVLQVEQGQYSAEFDITLQFRDSASASAVDRRVFRSIVHFQPAFEFQRVRSTRIIDIVWNATVAPCLPGTSAETLAGSTGAVCKPCLPGLFSVDGQSCQPCPAGSFSLVGSTNCTLCPAGSVAPSPGRGQCDSCDAGTFSPADGLLRCFPCTEVQYQPSSGGTECLPCPAGSTSRAGANAKTNCRCNPGFYGADGEECTGCDETMYCPGRGDPFPFPAPGYWRECYDKSLDECPMLQCLLRSNCKGGEEAYALYQNGTVFDTCAEGHQGRLCGDCEDRYYKASGSCVECPKEDTTYKMVLAALFLGIALIIVVYSALPVPPPEDLEEEDTGQKGDVAFNPSNTNKASRSRESGWDGMRVFSAPTISISFIQILSIFPTFKIPWPPVILSIFSYLSAFNLSFDVVSPECALEITWYEKWRVGMFIPIVITAIFVFVGIVAAAVSFVKNGFTVTAAVRREVRSAVETLAAGWLVFVLLAYVFMSHNTLALFDCTAQVDDTQTLDAQPSETCYSSKWNKEVFLGVIGILVYVLGVPCGFVALLLYVRRPWDPNANPYALMKNPLTQFVVKRYQKQYFFYEAFVLFRKLLLVVVALFFSQRPVVQISLAMMTFFSSLILGTAIKPYKENKHNFLEWFLMLANFLILFFGLLFLAQDLEDSLKNVLTVFVMILIVLAIITILIFVAMDVRDVLFPPNGEGDDDDKDEDDGDVPLDLLALPKSLEVSEVTMSPLAEADAKSFKGMLDRVGTLSQREFDMLLHARLQATLYAEGAANNSKNDSRKNENNVSAESAKELDTEDDTAQKVTGDDDDGVHQAAPAVAALATDGTPVDTAAVDEGVLASSPGGEEKSLLGENEKKDTSSLPGDIPDPLEQGLANPK